MIQLFKALYLLLETLYKAKLYSLKPIIMKIYAVLFLLISFAVSAQKTIETRRIITIKGNDTTIINTTTETMDSVIEHNMKSLYGINDGGKGSDSKIEVQVFVDSIFKGDSQTKILLNGFPEDTIRVKLGSKKIIVIDDEEQNENTTRQIIIDEDVSDQKKTLEIEKSIDLDDFVSNDYAHYAGFGLGINGLLNSNDKLAQEIDAPFLQLDYARSINLQFNFAEKRFPVYKEYVGITTGMGLQWNRYALNKNVDLVNASDSIYGVNNTLLNYTKNNLRSLYFQVPMLLDINTCTDVDKSWHFSFGVVGGLRVASSWKTKWEDNGNGRKAKTKDDYHLNPFCVNALMQVGYGHANLFVQYGFSQVFEKSKGPDFNPISAGLFFNF